MPRRPNRPAANASFASKRRYLLKVCGHADMLFGRMSYAEYEDDLMAQYASAKVMQEIGERLVPGNGQVARKRLTRRSASSMLSILQGDCWQQTGKPFGLAGGNRGSKAKHQPVDQAKAAAAHAQPARGPCLSVGSATNARKALF